MFHLLSVSIMLHTLIPGMLPMLQHGIFNFILEMNVNASQ